MDGLTDAAGIAALVAGALALIALIVLALLCLVLAVSLLASTTVIQPGQTRVCLLYTSPSPRD